METFHTNFFITKTIYFIVPGPPSQMHFPIVTYSTARVEWAPPLDPNGEVTGYWVSYRQADRSSETTNSVEVAHWINYYEVTNMNRDTRYVFEIYATTQQGVGEVRSSEVVTTINRGEQEYGIEARGASYEW